jgi:RHS repeat-associated protein
MTVAGQPTVNYTFNAANRLTAMTQGSSIVQTGYDAANRRTTLTLPNGIVTSYGYDAASGLAGMTYSFGSTLLGSLGYGYDLSGKRTSMSGSFARTGVPNAVSVTSYNANNQLTTWGTANLFYDADGNITSDGNHSYSWDARNQMKQIDSGATASFTYDPFGRRVNKTILGTSTNFLYDGANVVQELSGTTPTASLLTGSLDEYFTRTDSSGARYFLRDALGSTLALADSAGGLQTSYTFEPFGGTTIAGSTTSSGFAYTGRELDSTGLNLYFYRARYYNTQLQRFMSEDPIGFRGGINLYAYAGNGPTLWRDPTGRGPEALAPALPWVGISGPWGWVIIGGATALFLLILYLQTRTKSEPKKEPKCKDQEKCKEQYAADIAWCDETFGNDSDPSTYFACTQLADLNAERCLNGQERLNPDPRWYKKRY